MSPAHAADAANARLTLAPTQRTMDVMLDVLDAIPAQRAHESDHPAALAFQADSHRQRLVDHAARLIIGIEKLDTAERERRAKEHDAAELIYAPDVTL